VEKCRVEFRDDSLPGYALAIELNGVFGIGSCRIMARNELDCEDSMCDLKLQRDGYKSVVRIRLM
jgi:hypothetical protein